MRITDVVTGDSVNRRAIRWLVPYESHGLAALSDKAPSRKAARTRSLQRSSRGRVAARDPNPDGRRELRVAGGDAASGPDPLMQRGRP